MRREHKTEDYKKHLVTWANFALKQGPVESHAWEELHTKLSHDELTEILAVLAGYLAATPKGRALIEPWLEPEQ